jgi:hypothetical protein
MLVTIRDGKDHYALTGGTHVWVDVSQFAYLTFYDLLRLRLLRQDSVSKNLWELNEEGARIIDDVNYEPIILQEMKERAAAPKEL